MDLLAAILPIIIYFLLIILIIIVIILGIKLIRTLDKVDDLLDDINDKVQSLNGLFSVIDYTTDKISMLTDNVVEFFTTKIFKIFKKKKREMEDYE